MTSFGASLSAFQARRYSWTRSPLAFAPDVTRNEGNEDLHRTPDALGYLLRRRGGIPEGSRTKPSSDISPILCRALPATFACLRCALTYSFDP